MGLWVPLFHDMGLSALLSTLVEGSSVYLWQPGDFLRQTAAWLESFSTSDATALPAPNFAYDRLLRLAQEGLPGRLDLSRWRVAYNGAEPVREQTVEAFVEVFSCYGFEPEAMTPIYGLAEAMAAVALPRVGTRPRFESIR